jgi:hypothetical protein
MTLIDDSDYGYGGVDFEFGQGRNETLQTHPYYLPKKDGPLQGWSEHSLDNLKNSIGARDYGLFLQDRIGTFAANRMGPDGPPLKHKLDYNPADYGAPKIWKQSSGGITGLGDGLSEAMGGQTESLRKDGGSQAKTGNVLSGYVNALSQPQQYHLFMGTAHALSPHPDVPADRNPWLDRFVESRQEDKPHAGDHVVRLLAARSGEGGKTANPAKKDDGLRHPVQGNYQEQLQLVWDGVKWVWEKVSEAFGGAGTKNQGGQPQQGTMPNQAGEIK